MAIGQFLGRVGAGLVLVALGVGDAIAQGGVSTGPNTQIWANLTLGKTVNERTYFELDIEPKWQVTSGEEWRNIDFTPLAEYYPAAWLDLETETSLGHTHQRDGLNSLEVTPRIGARFHLFREVVRGLKRERLPIGRVDISTLVRLEWRNFFYSDDTPDRHEWRLRLRLEGKFAINHQTLSEDRTLYAIADAEYYLPLDDDVLERLINKVRARVGLGYRFSASTRLEVLYIRDWNRESPEGHARIDTQAVDLRLKMFF